jgi:long-chain alkane monooxygenase
MKKRILFNAFHMNCVVHQCPGLWIRPEDQMTRYNQSRNLGGIGQALGTWVLRCAFSG